MHSPPLLKLRRMISNSALNCQWIRPFGRAALPKRRAVSLLRLGSILTNVPALHFLQVSSICRIREYSLRIVFLYFLGRLRFSVCVRETLELLKWVDDLALLINTLIKSCLLLSQTFEVFWIYSQNRQSDKFRLCVALDALLLLTHCLKLYLCLRRVSLNKLTWKYSRVLEAGKVRVNSSSKIATLLSLSTF